MLRLLVLALAACGRITSSTPAIDSGVDVIDTRPPVDAAPDLPLDAYAPRPCDAPVTFADGRVPSRVLHVHAGAQGGDGSAAAPFGSIAAAAAVATPGTFIQLAPGVHAPNQLVVDLRGTADAPIWIGGADGTQPAIQGGSEALHLTRPAYVVVQNLELRYQASNGITIDDGVGYANEAHHVALVNLFVHDVIDTASSTAIRAAGVDHLFVYDSRTNDYGIGIDLVGVHHGVVARNQLVDSTFAAAQVRGGSTDVDVRQNRIRHGSGAGVSLGAMTQAAEFRPPLSTTTPNAEARRVRAFDNAITGSVYVPFSFVACVDCLVAHNLTYGAPSYLLRILQTSAYSGSYPFEPTSHGRVINNSFVWVTFLVGHVDVGPFTSPTTFTFSNNLWYSLDSPAQSTPALPVAETGSLINQHTGYVEAHTGYCDGPETGAALSLPEIDGTIDGFCRAGHAPTIGPQVNTLTGCDI